MQNLTEISPPAEILEMVVAVFKGFASSAIFWLSYA